MKKISIILEKTPELHTFIVSNLNEVFNGTFELECIYYSELKSLDAFDLVIVLEKEKVYKVLPFIKDTSKIVAINRTISHESYETIHHLVNVEEVVVINDTFDATMELITTLYLLGLSHIRFIPYSEQKIYEKGTFAINAGDERHIPQGMHSINIGYQPIDISSVISILSRMGEPIESYREALKAYQAKYITLQTKSVNSIKLMRNASTGFEKSAPETFRDNDEHMTFDQILTVSEAMRVTMNKAKKLAGHDIGVLLVGESGSGKSLIARAIHNASNRSKGPFVSVNMSSSASKSIESELFGLTSELKGVFELAEGGTVFLDEVGDLDLKIQGKLLSMLKESRIFSVEDNTPIAVNVRIIAATNKDLIEEINAGRFREDLYYRLKGALVKVPPLRERRGDILFLAKAFLPEKMTFSDEAVRMLVDYPWLGNVRELMNACNYIEIMDEDGHVDIEDLPDDLIDGQPPKSPSEDKVSRILDSISELSRRNANVEDKVLKNHLVRMGWDVDERELKRLLQAMKNEGLIVQQKGTYSTILNRREKAKRYHL